MDWMIEIGYALLRMLAQPLLYVMILLLLISGYFRIKNDRRYFGRKVFPYLHEMKGTLDLSIIGSVVLSAFALALGFVFTMPMLYVIAICVTIVTFMRRFLFLSGSYTIGITYLICFVLSMYMSEYVKTDWTTSFQQINFTYIPLLLAILLVIEGIMLFRVKAIDTFPEITMSLRGKYLGRHRIKKMVFIPFIGLLPSGLIESFDWWPVIALGDETYGLVVIPLFIGAEHAVRNAIPKLGAKWIATKLFLLATIMILLTVMTYFYPSFVWVSVLVAIVGRFLIQYGFRLHDQNQAPIFQLGNEGVLVLGVLPHSTAAELSIEPGEKILKLNGMGVNTEREFYDAVQVNRAFCKLAIQDYQGETRFAQTALFEDDHHELGILFVKEKYKKKAVSSEINVKG